MAIKTVAILSPGDMGHAVGRALDEHGLDVITCLHGRSERTKGLARQANIRDVPTLEDMVSQADIVLSILVQSEAIGVARMVADAIWRVGADTIYADCNAVSPKSVATMDAVIRNAGARFIDGSIVGYPPGIEPRPRIYVSGPDAGMMMAMDSELIEIKQLGDAIGRASSLKMCCSALTKGRSAVYLALWTAAELMGLSDELRAELASNNPDTLSDMERELPGLPTHASKYAGEMVELAETFGCMGVTSYLHRGAAEIFDLVARTPFAQEHTETVDHERTLEQTISAVVQAIPHKAGGRCRAKRADGGDRGGYT